MFQQFQTPDYATFWQRFAASLIDSVLMMAVFCPLGMALGALGAVVNSDGDAPELPAAASLMINLLSIVASWLYHALTESSSWQGTVGKKLLGIRVTDMNGHRIGFGRATGRYFGKIVSSFTCLIGYVMAAFTERRQALHDMMASTLVLQGAGGYAGITLDQAPPPPPSDFGFGR